MKVERQARKMQYYSKQKENAKIMNNKINKQISKGKERDDTEGGKKGKDSKKKKEKEKKNADKRN